MTLGGSNHPSVDNPPIPWLLDHIHSYPGGYEIPLRTMYTLNTSPRAQPLSPQPSRPQSPMLSGTSGYELSNANGISALEDAYAGAHAAAAQLKSSLMDQIACLPTQPCSLPPDFIISFARKCFPKGINQVNFPQALTGLDYLRDLDNRRRREIVAVLRRLGIDRSNVESTRRQRAMRHPFILRWIQSLEDKERHVENLYSHCYIGLRRWILINEMYTAPFNKPNCLAMLNTLFPPCPSTAPTPQLSVDTLTAQRNGYWRFIQAVERNGRTSLDGLMTRDQEIGDEAGWYSISESVEAYLRESKSFIEECTGITGMESFVPDEEAEESFNSFARSNARSQARSHRRGTPKKGSRSAHVENASNTSNSSNTSSTTDASNGTEASQASGTSSTSKSTSATTMSAQSSVDLSHQLPRRQVDSGISIVSSVDRPSSSGSKDSGYCSPGSTGLRKPIVKTGSRFERFARSFRKMGEKKKEAGIVELLEGADLKPEGDSRDGEASRLRSMQTKSARARKLSEPLLNDSPRRVLHRSNSRAGSVK